MERLQQLSLPVNRGIRIALQDFRFRCPPQSSPIIEKKPAAVLPLQILNMLRHGGLRHVEARRRLPVIHGLIEQDEGLNPVIYHFLLQSAATGVFLRSAAVA